MGKNKIRENKVLLFERPEEKPGDGKGITLPEGEIVPVYFHDNYILAAQGKAPEHSIVGYAGIVVENEEITKVTILWRNGYLSLASKLNAANFIQFLYIYDKDKNGEDEIVGLAAVPADTQVKKEG